LMYLVGPRGEGWVENHPKTTCGMRPRTALGVKTTRGLKAGPVMYNKKWGVSEQKSRKKKMKEEEKLIRTEKEGWKKRTCSKESGRQ